MKLKKKKNSSQGRLDLFKKLKGGLLFYYWKIIAVLLLVPMTVVCIFSYIVINNDYNDKIYNTQNVLLYKISATADSILYETSVSALRMAKNEYVLQYMLDFEKYVKSYDEHITIKKISTEIMDLIASNHYAASLYIYKEDSDYIIGSNYAGFFEDMQDKSWHDYYINGEVVNHICLRPDYKNPEENILSVIYNVVFEKERLGAVIINIDMRNIEVLDEYRNSETKNMFLDESGEIVYCPDKTLIGKNLFEIANVDYGQIDVSERAIENLRSRGNYISLVHSAEKDLIYAVVNLSDGIIGSGRIRFILSFAAIILFALLSIAYISYFVSNKLYSFIDSLIRILNTQESEDVPQNLKEEQKYIYHSFINMLNSKKDIELGFENKLIALKQMQHVALQLQMTPHFLFNTLQSINMVIMRIAGGDNDAAKMIMLLSELLRNSLDSDELIIRLGDELRYAEKYIEIQKIKYKDKFDVIWDVDEELYDASVLKMSFQPLIENSIAHGIKKLKTKGKIIISAKKENQRLMLYVIDNGNRIEEERLEYIKEVLRDDKIINSKNIGLSNLNRRCGLVFGEGYGCSINSNDVGTCVKVEIPYTKIIKDKEETQGGN